MFLRWFVTYILFSHERRLLAAKQQSNCIYVYIQLYICTYTCICRHQSIQGQESSSECLSAESNPINQGCIYCPTSASPTLPLLFFLLLQLLLFLINVPKCSLLTITRKKKDKRAEVRRGALVRKTICLANPFRKRQTCQLFLFRMVPHNQGREQKSCLMGLFSQPGIIMPTEKS